MTYEFFEHQADVGIIGIGKTLEEAFAEGAKAMFATMVEIDSVAAKRKIAISCEAGDEAGLFVAWLNELLAQKDIHEMMFSEFSVEIKRKGDRFSLTGYAIGEKLNLKKHKLKVEVKAATFSQLRVWQDGKQYKAKCVVDV